MKKTACFTGHRDIDADISALSSLLCSVLDRLITGAYGSKQKNPDYKSF